MDGQHEQRQFAAANPGRWSGCYAINVHGEIAGTQVEADGNSIGRYWSSSNDDHPLRLLPLVGDERSDASAINKDGVIVGWSEHRIKGFDPRPNFDPTKVITLKVERRPVVWRIVDGAVQGPFELPNLTDIDAQADPDNAFGVAVSLNDNDKLAARPWSAASCFPRKSRPKTPTRRKKPSRTLPAG